MTRRALLALPAAALAVLVGATPAMATTPTVNASVMTTNYQSYTSRYQSRLLVQTAAGAGASLQNTAEAATNCAECSATSVSVQLVLLTNPGGTLGPADIFALTDTNACYGDCYVAAYALTDVVATNGPAVVTSAGAQRLNALRAELADPGANVLATVVDVEQQLSAFVHNPAYLYAPGMVEHGPWLRHNAVQTPAAGAVSGAAATPAPAPTSTPAATVTAPASTNTSSGSSPASTPTPAAPPAGTPTATHPSFGSPGGSTPSRTR